jgi:hypothetical protein
MEERGITSTCLKRWNLSRDLFEVKDGVIGYLRTFQKGKTVVQSHEARMTLAYSPDSKQATWQELNGQREAWWLSAPAKQY